MRIEIYQMYKRNILNELRKGKITFPELLLQMKYDSMTADSRMIFWKAFLNLYSNKQVFFCPRDDKHVLTLCASSFSEINDNEVTWVEVSLSGQDKVDIPIPPIQNYDLSINAWGNSFDLGKMDWYHTFFASHYPELILVCISGS